MARRVRDRNLESREARGKLSVRGKPYYRAIAPGLSLGYRKGKRAHPWFARFYEKARRDYSFANIGEADDTADADNVKVFNFWQAVDRARELQKQRGGTVTPQGPYAVRDAVRDYLVSVEHKVSHYDIAHRLAAHVGELANKELSKLTATELTKWHRDLAKTLPLVRTKPGKAQAHRAIDLSDHEAKRQRENSANKVLGQMKAALNCAFRANKVSSDAEWRKVKPFKDVDTARVRYLTVAEAQRLINASDPAFRTLARAAIETGCRYSELARLRMSDFNPDTETVHIRTSKSGKPRHVELSEQGVAFFAQLTAGRGGDELMLGHEWRRSEQKRPMRAACERAGISPIGFHQLRHTWASLAIMNGTPLLVVAKNLGHVDTRMVEKHYGHMAPSYFKDAIRAGAPRFNIAGPSNVARLDAKQA
jgi:integrase